MLPPIKQIVTVVAISLLTTIALNYLAAKVPAVNKLTANG